MWIELIDLFYFQSIDERDKRNGAKVEPKEVERMNSPRMARRRSRYFASLSKKVSHVR